MITPLLVHRITHFVYQKSLIGASLYNKKRLNMHLAFFVKMILYILNLFVFLCLSLFVDILHSITLFSLCYNF